VVASGYEAVLPGVVAGLRPARRRRPLAGSASPLTADGASTYSLRAAGVPARSMTMPSIVSLPPGSAAASGKGQRDKETTRTGDAGARPVTDDGSGQRVTGTTWTNTAGYHCTALYQ